MFGWSRNLDFKTARAYSDVIVVPGHYHITHELSRSLRPPSAPAPTTIKNQCHLFWNHPDMVRLASVIVLTANLEGAPLPFHSLTRALTRTNVYLRPLA